MQGKYKTFEGTEIAVENCVKAKVKDLVVEGKTYQNLVTNLDELVGNVYTRDTVAIIDTSLFKANTTYTAIVTISESNYSHEKYGAIFSIFYPTLTNGYANISLKDGTFKLTFITKGETPSKIQVGVQYGNSAISSFKLNNLIILEGDYITKELPDEINEIESVTERENNILSVKINDNTTTLNLPIPLRALPNGVADTIEGNKLVQRAGKVVFDGSLDEEWEISNKINNLLNVGFLIESCVNKPRNPNIEYYYFCDKLPNQDTPITDTKTEGAMLHAKRIYIRIFLNKLDSQDIDGFRTWLSENPVTVYYELAEPIIHDLEIPQLSTTKGTNVITTSNNIKPNVRIKIKTK